jgi:tetrahydromethanopterin S-methyltransferase subunit B
VDDEPAGPVTAPDGIFRRSGDSLEALPSAEIRDRIVTAASSDFEKALAPLTPMLETLTGRVLDLEKSLIAANSWRRRLPDMLIGAAISAFLGLLLALLVLP